MLQGVTCVTLYYTVFIQIKCMIQSSARNSILGIHCHCQTKFLSEVDFDFTPFLEEITSTDSVYVFTAISDTSLDMFPSGEMPY